MVLMSMERLIGYASTLGSLTRRRLLLPKLKLRRRRCHSKPQVEE